MNDVDPTPGEEQFEEFTGVSGGLCIQYEYCSTDNELYACVAKDLVTARARRDRWLLNKRRLAAIKTPS